MTSANAMTTSYPSSQERKSQFNPLLFAHNMAEAGKIWQDIIRLVAQEDAFCDIRSGDIGLWHFANDYCQWFGKVMKDPSRLMQLGYVWLSDSAQLWQKTVENFITAEGATEENQDDSKDRRFSGDAWQNSVFYDYIKKQYLMTSSWMQDTVQRLDDELDQHTQNKLNFYTKQWLDAIAPSNFLITNPEVLQAALESNGETILKGLYNLREDFERGRGKLAISTTDNKAFEVGKNLAATEGSVIYQNDLMQLIQYKPQTETVYSTPLLLIPAWINKFYIFDMQKKNSFVQWLLQQGYSVFIISWVNPEAQHRDKTFAHYMQEGLLKAVDVIRDVTSSDTVNCVGYCLGGTLLATTLAWLHARGEKEASGIASATYLTTMIDFSDPGELGVFIDEDQIQAIEMRMQKKGYLEGSEMATTFSLLRSNNMIWSFVINNYLLGKEPFPFDLLYWNSDCTRMPAAMHSFYLRNMYQQNRLVQKGSLEIAGETIDITRIKTPTFILSTREDHIAPWQSTYAATQYYSGEVEFVLAGSGHIAGVINPPEKQKYGYWTNKNLRHTSSDMWLRDAQENPGSWWGYWHEWLSSKGNQQRVNAYSVGNQQYRTIEAAPGSYVKVR